MSKKKAFDPNQVLIGILDKKSDLFIEFAAVSNHAVAIRAFTDGINRDAPENNLFKWPDDFDLYLLGEYDNRTGDLAAKKTRLAQGTQVKIRNTKH